MVCSFFGHRNAPHGLEPELIGCIKKLIMENNAKVFYVGTQGEFDRIVWNTLSILKNKYPHINCYKVLAYLPTNKEYGGEDTIYPEGLETVPRKLAIIKRNEWMINNSDMIVSYVRHSGGADTFVDLARRKGKFIVEI